MGHQCEYRGPDGTRCTSRTGHRAHFGRPSCLRPAAPARCFVGPPRRYSPLYRLRRTFAPRAGSLGLGATERLPKWAHYPIITRCRTRPVVRAVLRTFACIARRTIATRRGRSSARSSSMRRSPSRELVERRRREGMRRVMCRPFRPDSTAGQVLPIPSSASGEPGRDCSAGCEAPPLPSPAERRGRTSKEEEVGTPEARSCLVAEGNPLALPPLEQGEARVAAGGRPASPCR